MPLVPALTPEVSPRALLAEVAAFARAIRRDRGGAGQSPGATTAPLDQISDPSAWETYRRTNTKLPHRSFSLPFLPSRWPGRCQVSQHAASHSSSVPDPIIDCSGDLAPGAHTSHKQLPYLGAPEATPSLHRACVRARACVCVCV